MITLVLSPSRAAADAHTWSGNTSADWSAAVNWSSGGAPQVGEAQPIDLTFPPGTADFSYNNIPGLTVHALYITRGGITISGNSVTLTGEIGFSAVAASAVVNLNMTLSVATHSFNVSDPGSTLSIAGDLSGAAASGCDVSKDGQGQVNLSGSNAYTHQTMINQGILNVASNLALGNTPASVTYVNFNASGAALQVQGSTGLTIPVNLVVTRTGVGGTGAILVTNSSTTFTGTMSVGGVTPFSFGASAGATLTFAGTVTGFGFTKVGAGTMVLGGSCPYANGTTVDAGTLLVNGTLTQSAITVNTGATLGGTGSAQVVTASSGSTVAPGQSPGILGTGSVTLGVGSAYAVEINGAAQYDQLNVVGSVTLGATLSVSLGYVPAAGTQFTIINNDGADAVTGTFAGIPERGGMVIGGTELVVSYLGSDFATGNDVVLTAVNMPSATITPAGVVPRCSSPLTLTATPQDGSGMYIGYQWYLNTVAIGGANASTYGATATGTYTVTVTDSVGATGPQSAAVTLTTDVDPPAVTSPADATATQSLCQ